MAESNSAAYSYEAALKQLNIDPQTISSLRNTSQIDEERAPPYFLPDLSQVDSQLQQLSSKKIQKLECLIQQHTSTIAALQSDLAVCEQARHSHQEQASQLESLVAQYESRFAQVRNILEQKEFEISTLQDEVQAAKSQIQSLDSHTSDLSLQLASAHDTIHSQQSDHTLQLSHLSQNHDSQLAKLSQAHSQELTLCRKQHDAEKIRLAQLFQQEKDSLEQAVSELTQKLSAQVTLLSQKEVEYGFTVQQLEQKVEAQAQLLGERQKSQNESILESHIDKLRAHIQELQTVNCSLDQQNQQLTLQIQQQEASRVDRELKDQEASFKLQQQIDLLRLQSEEQQLSAKESTLLLQSQHEVALRQKQRELDSAQQQLKRLQLQLHDQQSQYTFDNQSLQQRWQDKYNDLKEQLKSSNEAQQTSLEHERELRDALRQLRFEHKAATKALQSKDSEIAGLQSKYEEIIEAKESELLLHKQCSKEAEDKLKFEIEYLKRQEPKTAEKPAMIPAEEVPFRVSGGSNQFKQGNVQPSPYVQAFLKSTFKHQQSLNDSLDKLQREFMQGYNEAMMLSDAKPGDLPMVQGSSQGFKQENEALRDRIQQMRVDMDAMMTKVKDELQTKPQDVTPYKQKIADLEAMLRSAESKVARLSEERDQLCQISAELRAELNRQQRLIADMMTPKSPARAKVNFSAEEPKTMFDDNLRFSQASHEQIINYGNKLTEIAGELQELAKKQQSPTRERQQSPQRPLQVLTKSPGKSKSRSPVNRHLAQIREIRKNLEVEGQALQGFYKQQRQDELIRQSQSEKQTKSQLSAANRLLQAQNKKLKDKQITRQEMIKNAQKQGVRNYAVQDDLPVDFGATVSDIEEVRQDSPSPQDVGGGVGVRYHQDDHNMLMNIGNYAMREEKPQTAAAGRSRKQSRSPDDLVSVFGAKRQQSPQKPSPQRSRSRSNNGGRKTKEKVRDYRIAGARPLSHTKIEGAELII